MTLLSHGQKVILAHELEHLLHNALDSGEYNWIDEGAADMAAYLCFGGSSTLYGHVNAWTQRASIHFDGGTNLRIRRIMEADLFSCFILQTI